MMDDGKVRKYHMCMYKSKRSVLLLTDIIAIVISFFVSFGIRNKSLHETFGNTYGLNIYLLFLIYALILYVIVCLVKQRTRLEKLSGQEIFLKTLEHQAVFVGAYVILFFVLHRVDQISRLFVGLFALLNVVLCSVGRILYHAYCVKKSTQMVSHSETIKKSNEKVEEKHKAKKTRHVFVIGCKSIGLYGGFESFVLNLLQQHKDNKQLQYHIACKANGNGFMDLTKLPGAVSVNDEEFTYCNAHCVLIPVPKKIGAAQAIYYDIKALRWACGYIERNHIDSPIVYILASRIGLFERKYVERIHDAGGLVYQNPDGHEDWRGKWSLPIRKYWKFSEQLAVKNADLIICDSKSIEEYIKDEYSEYQPKTTFIAYGSYVTPSALSDNDPKYTSWLSNHNLVDRQFYTVVGRFVPENNFETIIINFYRVKNSIMNSY